MATSRGNLYLFACGARPAEQLHEMVELAQATGWVVHVGATPAGLDFLDVQRLTAMTGSQVRHTWSRRTSGWPPADAVVVAPATLNTIGKFALGISDTWVANVLIESLGLGVPIVVAANVNPALGRHPGFRRNVANLRSWGVSVLWEPEPEPPVWIAPWPDVLDELHRVTERAGSA
jgi:phosphopantothenoylcysteine synthetase/decarboxylase